MRRGEFWHFSRGDAYEAVLRGQPGLARFGPVEVDLATGAVVSLADPTSPLTPLAEIEQLLAAALERVDRGRDAASTSLRL
jgi:hypothetical protein